MIHGFSEFDDSSIDLPIVARSVLSSAPSVPVGITGGRRCHTGDDARDGILRTLGAAARAWWDDDCARLGASLAYYTLFAIAPVLLVATAIAGMVFGAEAVRGEIVGQLDHLVGREGALAVQSLLEGASQRRAGIVATVIGSIAFLVAATGAFLELQVAFNTIWRVKPKPGAHFKAFVIDRVALVRPGGGDRLPAAGLARGDRGAGRAQRVALALSPGFPTVLGASSARWSRSW